MQRTVWQHAPFPRPAFGAALGLCLLLAACEQPEPRTFAFFMDDSIARDGTLARCNEDPIGTTDDIECAHARRAALSIALRQERERREALEIESQRKIEELKQEMVERERIAREAALAAAREEREAYEAMWRERGAVPDEVFGTQSAAADTAAAESLAAAGGQ
jgi:hypothetical protein